MAKLSKQYYYTAKNKKKINCYHAFIPKRIVEKSNINEDDEISVSVYNGNILIQKASGDYHDYKEQRTEEDA